MKKSITVKFAFILIVVTISSLIAGFTNISTHYMGERSVSEKGLKVSKIKENPLLSAQNSQTNSHQSNNHQSNKESTDILVKTLSQIKLSPLSLRERSRLLEEMQFNEKHRFSHAKPTSPSGPSLPVKKNNTRLGVIINEMVASQTSRIIPKKGNTAQEVLSLMKSKEKYIGFWETVHSIESKQGRLMYRPSNLTKSCTFTSSPCGHHQLTTQALKDIACDSLQCRIDRLDYNKSLSMSKKLLALNEERLSTEGIDRLHDYQRYLIHQQGAAGIKRILNATQGKTTIPEIILKNMANNSPYTYEAYKKMGSKLAATAFMKYWEKKWVREKFLIARMQKKSESELTPLLIPTFSESELYLALNQHF